VRSWGTSLRTAPLPSTVTSCSSAVSSAPGRPCRFARSLRGSAFVPTAARRCRHHATSCGLRRASSIERGEPLQLASVAEPAAAGLRPSEPRVPSSVDAHLQPVQGRECRAPWRALGPHLRHNAQRSLSPLSGLPDHEAELREPVPAIDGRVLAVDLADTMPSPRPLAHATPTRSRAERSDRCIGSCQQVRPWPAGRNRRVAAEPNG